MITKHRNSPTALSIRAFFFSTITLCISSVLSSSCGANLSKSNPIFRCSNSDTDTLELKRPHFVTRQLVGSQIDGASVLYQLNSQTMKAQPVVIRGSDSTDSWAFRDTKQNEIFFLERFTSKPQSRMTRFTCDNGNRKQEVGDLPANTFGLGYLTDQILIALGWNDSVYAALRPDFTRATAADAPSINKIKVAGNAQGLGTADTHFNSLLVQSRTPGTAPIPFVLSSGYSLETFVPTQARLLKLDNLMQETVEVFDVPECFNAYQDFTFQISQSEIFLGCNPQYAGQASNQAVRLVSVALNQNAQPEFKVFDINATGEAQILRPSGVSADKQWVFVTEQTTSSQSADANPGKYLRSYWLNKKTGQQLPMNKLAGDVIFDEVERNYIFSCVVSEDLKCRRNTFAILPEAEFANPDKADFKASDFLYDFFHFERAIF